MSSTLTKADIVEHIIGKTGSKKSEAKKMVESFFDIVSTSLENGDNVKLSGFGNFSIREKRERPGRNPKTKEAAIVSARKVVTFRPGAKLSSRVLKSGV